MARKVTISDAEIYDGPGAPFIVAMFGIGWLVGAKAEWYWGALIVVLAAAWQMYRNRKKRDPLNVVIDDMKKEKK